MAANPFIDFLKSTLKASESAADNGIFKTIFSKGAGSVIMANSAEGAEAYMNQLGKHIAKSRRALNKAVKGGATSIQVAGRAIDQAGLDAIASAHKSLRNAYNIASKDPIAGAYGNISATANKLGSRYFGDGKAAKHWMDSSNYARTRGILGGRSGFASTEFGKAFASDLYSASAAPKGLFENMQSYYLPRLADGSIDRTAMAIRGGASAIAGGAALGFAIDGDNRLGGTVIGAGLGTGLSAGAVAMLGKI